MAVLTGTIDGNALPEGDTLVNPLGVESVLVLQNHGSKVITISVNSSPIEVYPLNSKVFFLPAGTAVTWSAPGSTASYQLAVPG